MLSIESVRELWWLYTSSEIPLEDVVQEEIDMGKRITAWFKNGGGKGSGEAHIIDKKQRAGLRAAALVKKGDMYLEIPWNLIVSRELVLASKPYGEALGRTEINALRITKNSEIASAVLLCTYILCDSETHREYIEALPRNFSNHPLTWKLLNRINDLNKNTWFEAFQESKDSLRSFVALCRCARDSALPSFRRGQYVWAYLIWSTRCIGTYIPETSETFPCFVPMVDMTNCAYSRIAHCSRTVIHNNPKRASMRTPLEIRKGDEIFENYGWANFDYFLNHGFFHQHSHPDEALVCRSQSIYASNSALDILLPQRTGLYLREWRPRLCVNTASMRFNILPSIPPFDPEWPFTHFNFCWSKFRNHSFLVAIALELDSFDSITNQDSLDQALARAATTSVVIRAWTRLAQLAREEEWNLQATITRLQSISSSVNDDDQTLRQLTSLTAFFQSQIELARHIAQEYDHQARLCVKPPPYAVTSQD